MTTANIIPLPHKAGVKAAATKAGHLAGVPRQLWVRQAIIVGIALLVAFVGLKTYLAYSNVVQTIGKDAVPSIVAAEKIRTQLADAHTNIVNAFLTKEQDDTGPSRQAYNKSIASAYDSLVEAAQNITYGDEERRPILAVLTQLSDYERLIGKAEEAREREANHGDATDTSDAQLIGSADGLMREHILPSVVALDQANFTHLDAAFTQDRKTARQWLYGFIASALVLGAMMLETQLKLYSSFRRIINPPMAIGLAIFALSLLMFSVYAANALSEIRTAKEDAFDSVHALSKTKAIAYTANAQESVYLLQRDKSSKALQATGFNDSAVQIYSGGVQDIAQLPADLKLLKNQGLLGDELANITFPGEEAAARKALQGWFEYVHIDSQVRSLEESGKHDAAVALCIGNQAMQSDWAFENFMQSLDETLNINQVQFDNAIARAFKYISLLWMLLIPILLGPVIGTVIGLQLRLAEFRD